MLSNAPFETILAKSNSAVFCFCDHASNHVPQSYNNLGLSSSDLDRHIGWDIGAETLTRQFCKTFGAAGLLARFSRLLIDPNRALDSKGLIPATSDSLTIPGNQSLSGAERRQRIARYYVPYHSALEIALDQAEAREIDPLIISIHSFTPAMASGERRALDIGILWKVDEDKAQRLRDEIIKIHPYKIGLNQPYSALKLNHTVDQHVIPRGLRHVTLEVRQDLIDTDDKALIVARRLSDALTYFIH